MANFFKIFFLFCSSFFFEDELEMDSKPLEPRSSGKRCTFWVLGEQGTNDAQRVGRGWDNKPSSEDQGF